MSSSATQGGHKNVHDRNDATSGVKRELSPASRGKCTHADATNAAYDSVNHVMYHVLCKTRSSSGILEEALTERVPQLYRRAVSVRPQPTYRSTLRHSP